MRDEIVTLRITTADKERWTAVANAEGRSLSNWMRRCLDSAVEVAGTREPGKESEPEQTSRTVMESLNRGLPRARSVKRKHLPEIHNPERTPGGRGINLCEEEEAERPGKKVRCTYLWPSNSKKCPRCGQVHSDV